MKKTTVRVRLIKTEDETYLPVGTLGTVIDPPLVEHGMNTVKWDFRDTVAMYRNEIEEVKS